MGIRIKMSYGEECTEVLQRSKLEGKFYLR